MQGVMKMIKVMIADDEERICQLIEALIDWESLHMEVVGIAHNGLEAREMVRQIKPDVLITDIRMPGCNGLELIENVKKSVEDLQIVIISGYAHFAYAQTAIKYGVGDYLLKPINKVELASTLQKFKERIEEKIQLKEEQLWIQHKSKADIRLFRVNLMNRLLEQKVWRPTLEILQEEYYLQVQEGIFQGFVLKVDATEDISQAGIHIILEKTQTLLENSLKTRPHGNCSRDKGQQLYWFYQLCRYQDRRDAADISRLSQSTGE